MFKYKYAAAVKRLQVYMQITGERKIPRKMPPPDITYRKGLEVRNLSGKKAVIFVVLSYS